MYIFFGDETCESSKKDKAEFFIYGGIFFVIEKLHHLNNEVEKIRNDAGYKRSQEFKFCTDTRPSNVSIDKFKEAKSNLLDLCKNNDVNLISCVVLHNIANTIEKKHSYPVSEVLAKFDNFLSLKKDTGICIFDRIPKANLQINLIKEKYQKGLVYSGAEIRLDNIESYSISSIGASNIGSIIDIVLGSLGYCINNRRDIDVAKNLMKKVFPLFITKKTIDNEIKLFNQGLLLRPSNVQIKSYERQYDDLRKNLKSLIESI